MDRYEKSRIAGILGIIGNIFLLIIKGIIGLMTKSQSMIADAANSAGDIFASLMTYIGNKIASEPKDDTHNLGHGKAEYIFSMFISISMMAVALKLLYDSIISLVNMSTFEFSWMLVIVCIITIITKLSLYLYTNKLSKGDNNLLLDANKKDHRNDCIITTFTLISILLSLVNIYWFDSVVGIGISIWIFYTGLKIFIESFNVLMDKSLNEEDRNKILDVLKKYPEIKKYNHLNTTPVGYKYLVSITIFVDGNMSTFESHDIADKLEDDLDKLNFVYLAIIHVNPLNINGENKLEEIKKNKV